jgi:hypothetical protein
MKVELNIKITADIKDDVQTYVTLESIGNAREYIELEALDKIKKEFSEKDFDNVIGTCELNFINN